LRTGAAALAPLSAAGAVATRFSDDFLTAKTAVFGAILTVLIVICVAQAIATEAVRSTVVGAVFWGVAFVIRAVAITTVVWTGAITAAVIALAHAAAVPGRAAAVRVVVTNTLFTATAAAAWGTGRAGRLGGTFRRARAAVLGAGLAVLSVFTGVVATGAAGAAVFFAGLAGLTGLTSAIATGDGGVLAGYGEGKSACAGLGVHHKQVFDARLQAQRDAVAVTVGQKRVAHPGGGLAHHNDVGTDFSIFTDRDFRGLGHSVGQGKGLFWTTKIGIVCKRVLIEAGSGDCCQVDHQYVAAFERDRAALAG
jgi:hypothetical protein